MHAYTIVYITNCYPQAERSFNCIHCFIVQLIRILAYVPIFGCFWLQAFIVQSLFLTLYLSLLTHCSIQTWLVVLSHGILTTYQPVFPVLHI